MDMTLPCIVCKKELTSVFSGSSIVPNHNQPNDGIVCSSGGNYGSRVWDTMDRSHIEINICDICLVDAAEQKQVLWVREKHRRPEWDVEYWSKNIE